MAVSKVTYDGHTLIDLTGDTAVAADVLTGKKFHLANGTQATGTNTGGITPTGTVNITANGIVDVTSYASANVAVPGPSGSINISSNGSHDVSAYATAVVNVSGGNAVFARACAVTITLDNSVDEGDTFNLDVKYRGYDPSSPINVIWKTEQYIFTDSVTTVTKTIYLCPVSAPLDDGIYIPVGDGGTVGNITSALNATPRYMQDTGETGSEHVYVTLSGNTASFNVYISGM